MRKEDLSKVMGSVKELPVLPDIAEKVLRLSDDPAVSLGELSDTIQKDPAMTARLLQIGNSPLYGLSQQVSTLKLALVVVGVREIKNIVLGASVFGSFCKGPAEQLARSLWQHSLQVAGMNRKLGSHLALGLQAEDFVAGLLHDIGKMLLMVNYGRVYTRLIDKTPHGSALCAVEADMFGFTHADAGAALAQHWNLPPALANAFHLHHDGAWFGDEGNPRLAALTCIANQAIYENGAMGAIAASPAWDALASPMTPADPAARAQLLQEFAAGVRVSEGLALS